MEKTQCLTNIVTSFYNNVNTYMAFRIYYKYNKDQVCMRDIHPHSISIYMKVWKDESHISKSRKIHLLLLLLLNLCLWYLWFFFSTFYIKLWKYGNALLGRILFISFRKLRSYGRRFLLLRSTTIFSPTSDPSGTLDRKSALIFKDKFVMI